MEQPHYIFFIYGLCFMFYGMMTWIFWQKRSERLSRFVMALMAVIAIQCLKDVFFLNEYLYDNPRIWAIMTSVDMVAVPLYAFILMELCRPGMVTTRMIVAQMAPVREDFSLACDDVNGHGKSCQAAVRRSACRIHEKRHFK